MNSISKYPLHEETPNRQGHDCDCQHPKGNYSSKAGLPYLIVSGVRRSQTSTSIGTWYGRHPSSKRHYRVYHRYDPRTGRGGTDEPTVCHSSLAVVGLGRRSHRRHDSGTPTGRWLTTSKLPDQRANFDPSAVDYLDAQKEPAEHRHAQ